jgi:CrcB protein
LTTIVLFAAAAAVGAVARAEAGRRWNRHDGIPYGILAVNVVGSFVLGLLWNVGTSAMTVLGVGGVGTLTTFSSFARDVVSLAQGRGAGRAVAYLLASLGAGIGAAALGVALVT